MTESQELLAVYVRTGSESAFSKLVEMYSGLVYSTALRLVDGDADRARDVSQTVFIDLARMAGKLATTSMLGGWLHRHTCFVAGTLMRGERRRKAREEIAYAMNTLTPDEESRYQSITPILDEAIQRLGVDDRDVIILRFFEGLNLRAVGETLGVSENVAQKRVSRALGELRVLLGGRGAAISAATLGTILAAKAVSTMPVGLASALAGAALSTTAGVSPSLPIAAASKFKPVLMGMLLAMGIGVTFLAVKNRETPVSTPIAAATNERPATPPVSATLPPPVRPTPLPKPQPTDNRVIPLPKRGDVEPSVARPSPSRILRTPPTQSSTYLFYKAQPTGSLIRIDGDSTMHEWYMAGQMVGGTLALPSDASIDSATGALTGVRDGVLNAKVTAIIPVRSIHSEIKVGSSIMDGIYQEALKEKLFPRITFVSDQLVQNTASAAVGRLNEFDAFGKLAIAGVTNEVILPVALEFLQNGAIRVTGRVGLKMTDFGITPPAPNIGLGAMKCKDDVTVTFNWLVSATTASPTQVASKSNQPRTGLVPLRIDIPPPAYQNPRGFAGGPNLEPLQTNRPPFLVPPDVQNLAVQKEVTSSDKNIPPDHLAKIVDGDKGSSATSIVLLRKGLQWVQIDLGQPAELYGIVLWHAYDVPKVYHKVIVQISDDPSFSAGVTTVFNNDEMNAAHLGRGRDKEYYETNLGKLIEARGSVGRYVRLYSAGSTDSAMNEYTEVEVYGL